jgi:hypothetical protein
MHRAKITGIFFLLMAIYGVGTAFATASDFFDLQNSSSSFVVDESESLEAMVLVFTIKFAITFALFWLGIRKFELIE